MARIGFFKRIVKEDFPAENQELVDKLAYPINSALESIANAFNKNLTIEDNLNEHIKDVAITVDGSGTPTPKVVFKPEVSSKVRGISVIRVENLTTSTSYPSGTPFITFSESSGLINIVNITNLTVGNEYKIRLRITG